MADNTREALAAALDMFALNCPNGPFQIQAPDGDYVECDAATLRVMAAAIAPETFVCPCATCKTPGRCKTTEQAAPTTLCACNKGLLLSSYSGGGAPEGWAGRVTIQRDGVFVDYAPAERGTV